MRKYSLLRFGQFHVKSALIYGGERRWAGPSRHGMSSTCKSEFIPRPVHLGEDPRQAGSEDGGTRTNSDCKIED